MSRKPKIFITRALLPQIIRLAKKQFAVSVNSRDADLRPSELIKRAKGADGIVSMLADRIGESLFLAAPRLKIVANYAVGYNNIDLEAARACNIVATNTPGVLTEATADLTWTLILAAARRVTEGDRLVRSGRWKGWGPRLLLGSDLAGKTIGIVGFGRIGRAVARRATGFQMKILYSSRRRADRQVEAQLAARQVPFDTILSEADILSLHLPLTEESRHLIGGRALSKMKPTAILINTARGPIVDEAALARALASGRPAAAGLDVFEGEPKIHPALLRLRNVVLLPHLGSATVETRMRMGEVVLENLRAFFAGEEPPNRVC